MSTALIARLLRVVRKRSDHTILTQKFQKLASPFLKIFIRKLYRLKNLRFYCHKNYPLYGNEVHSTGKR